MRKKILSLALIATLSSSPLLAQKIVYEKSDSVKIVSILKKAARLGAKTNKVVWFGKQFIGVPYVGATLEVGDTERLVVNTRQLDCTTFVETVMALTLADKANIRTFEEFCRQLERVRYRGGKNNGYTSRLHYFAFWVDDNEKKGIVKDHITPLTSKSKYIESQTLMMNFMTEHSDKYKHLNGKKERVKEINSFERAFDGMKVGYVPKKWFNLGPKALYFIHDGDIIGLTTKKEGLDTSHLGIIVWKNGKMHLMNASQLRGKVVLETNTLYKYSQNQKSQTGMRVIRVM